MGILTWIVVVVVILAIIGLGAATFFTGVWRGAEVIGDNPAVQNATGPAREFFNDTIKSGTDGTGTAELTTEKATYKRGEPITFTVKNIGDEALDFPNSVYGLKVTNTDSGEEIGIFSSQVITSLEPGQSKSITLELEGGDGQPAEAGDYTAEIYTTPKANSAAAQTSFSITEQ
jgi:hypothetical protein